MRGSTADVRGRQEVYVDDFREAAPVLDVGCGRGGFLGPAARRGSRGARCRPRPGHGRLLPRGGPRRRAGRRLAYLGRSRTARSAGVFAAQVSSTCRRGARAAARAGGREASRRRPRRRDDEPARARRAEELLRRPDARAAARSRDAGPARPPGGLRGGDVRFLNEPPPEERLRRSSCRVRPAASTMPASRSRPTWPA